MAVGGAMTLALLGIVGTSYGPPPGPFWGYLGWSLVVLSALATLWAWSGADHITRPFARRLGWNTAWVVLAWTVGAAWAYQAQWSRTTPAVTAASAVPPAAPAPTTVATSPRPNDMARIYLTQTPQALAHLYDENTSVQADALMKAYLGKWMHVTGEVDDVSSGLSLRASDTPDVNVSAYAVPVKTPRKNGVRLSLWFHPADADAVRHLRPGDQILATCRVREAQFWLVILEECRVGHEQAAVGSRHQAAS